MSCINCTPACGLPCGLSQRAAPAWRGEQGDGHRLCPSLPAVALAIHPHSTGGTAAYNSMLHVPKTTPSSVPQGLRWQRPPLWPALWPSPCPLLVPLPLPAPLPGSQAATLWLFPAQTLAGRETPVGCTAWSPHRPGQKSGSETDQLELNRGLGGEVRGRGPRAARPLSMVDSYTE